LFDTSGKSLSSNSEIVCCFAALTVFWTSRLGQSLTVHRRRSNSEFQKYSKPMDAQ